jgi:hypothetical protein
VPVRAVPVRPPVAAPERTVPVLRSLLGWLTAPRFLHRNP